MILNIIATLILAYFIAREVLFVLRTWAAHYDRVWVFVGALLVLAFIIPLWAVWA